MASAGNQMASIAAIRGVFRRYREDLFTENIPLDAAELMEKRLEELEMDILAIINRNSKKPNVGPTVGLRRPTQAAPQGQ
jgi:hypothetical protein